MYKIIVVIPTRLTNTQNLERAIDCIAAQQLPKYYNIETIIGYDHGFKMPPYVSDKIRNTKFMTGTKQSQAAALNSVIFSNYVQNTALEPYVAILEDDDLWHPTWLQTAINTLAIKCNDQGELYEFVTGNQLLVHDQNTYGRPSQIFDYPTPSTWVTKASTYKRVGPFNHMLHLDRDYLGRLNSQGIRRAHLVESGATPRKWLQMVSINSDIVSHGHWAPLVTKLASQFSNMGNIQSGRHPTWTYQSAREQDRLYNRYGVQPT